MSVSAKINISGPTRDGKGEAEEDRRSLTGLQHMSTTRVAKCRCQFEAAGCRGWRRS